MQILVRRIHALAQITRLWSCRQIVAAATPKLLQRSSKLTSSLMCTSLVFLKPHKCDR